MRGHAYTALTLCLTLLILPIQPSAGLYHTRHQILDWFKHASRTTPSKVKFRTLADRPHQHRLYHAAVTNYKSPGDPAARKQVVFVFGEHAREVITSEVGLWFARLLVGDHSRVSAWPELHTALARLLPSPPQGWEEYIHGAVDKILDQVVIQVVPIESLVAREMWEAGAICQRKTASQVDLNRNWPFAWRSAPAGDEQYGGPRPLSEPESRLLKALLVQRPTLGYVNVHSGEWAVYTPWDSKDGYAPGLPVDLPKLVQKIATLCNCRAGPAGSVSGYLAFGSSMDWAYVEGKVPYPITIEVYGGGDVGKLSTGQKNKDWAEFRLLDQDGKLIAATPAPQQAQEQSQGQQQAQQQQPAPRRLLRSRRQHMHLDAQEQQQQQQQAAIRQMHQAAPSNAAAVSGEQARSLQQLLAAAPPSDHVLAMVAKADPGQQACFASYNPPDEANYRRVAAEWIAVFLVTLQHMVEHEVAH